MSLTVVGNPEACEGLPDRNTFVRGSDHSNVITPAPWDFPLFAKCLLCGLEIFRADSLYSNWKHTQLHVVPLKAAQEPREAL